MTRPADPAVERVRSIIDAINGRHFSSGIRMPSITIVEPDFWEGNAAAQVMPQGGRTWLLVARDILDFRQFLSDVVTHEAIHMWQAQRDEPRVHDASFAAIANRIGRALGLADVEPGTSACHHWPCLSRPAGFYLDVPPRFVAMFDRAHEAA
jgi:hypothetical protein